LVDTVLIVVRRERAVLDDQVPIRVLVRNRIVREAAAGSGAIIEYHAVERPDGGRLRDRCPGEQACHEHRQQYDFGETAHVASARREKKRHRW
jgi:hypothetical protein